MMEDAHSLVTMFPSLGSYSYVAPLYKDSKYSMLRGVSKSFLAIKLKHQTTQIKRDG